MEPEAVGTSAGMAVAAGPAVAVEVAAVAGAAAAVAEGADRGAEVLLRRRIDREIGPMSESDLLAVYRAYLQCLNDRQWPRLGEFVADQLTYNGRRITLRDYRAILEGDVDAIPDLQYQPEVLIAADDVVACRLFFECTPRRTFLGFEPTGGQVSFPEHVFYRFDDDRRIAEVWSVIDLQAIREQVMRGS